MYTSATYLILCSRPMEQCTPLKRITVSLQFFTLLYFCKNICRFFYFTYWIILISLKPVVGRDYVNEFNLFPDNQIWPRTRATITLGGMISRPLGSFKSSGKKGWQKGRKKKKQWMKMVWWTKQKNEKQKKLFSGEDLGTLFKLGLGRLSRTMEQCTPLQRT